MEELSAKRIAIDGVTSLSVYETDKSKKRRNIAHLFQGLTETDCTCVVSTEIQNSSLDRSFQIEDYLSDGLIILQPRIRGNRLENSIYVAKMRGISHDKQQHPYNITEKGIIIYHKETII